MKKFKQIIAIVWSVILLILCSCNKDTYIKKRDTVSPKSKPKKVIIPLVEKSSQPTIEGIFNSKSTKWEKSGTIAQAKFIRSSDELGYEFICDFSKVKDRCVWDVENINIDLSEKSFVSFDIDMTAPHTMRELTIYLCFSGKWISRSVKVIEGRQKVIIDLNSEKFLKVKETPLTSIRISPWKLNNTTAKIVIFNVKSGSGEMVIVPNKVWYKKEEQVVSAEEFDLSTIKKLKFKNYSSSNHLFLIGQPAKLIIHKGFLHIPKDMSIECQDYTIDEGLKKFIKKYATTPSGVNNIKVNCKIDPNLSIPGKTSSEDSKRFKSKEAYYLKINKDSITLIGKSHLGILRGLASIALMGSSQKSKKEKVINCAEIWEAPSVNVRMYEGGANQPTMQRRRDIVDLLYLLRYNAHTMQVLGYVSGGSYFPFDSLPEDLRANSSTKEEWKNLSQYYKNRGIEFIPKIFSFSRAGIILSRPEYNHLSETTGLEQGNFKKDKDNKNFCSSNPKSYELVFGLLSELIETLTPKTINIALDEIMTGNTTCETHCLPSKRKSDWLKDVVLKTHAFLKSKGVATVMYGDMLDPYCNGHQIGINDWKFLKSLPKDIIIADWRYGIRDKYPSISEFTKHGFRTLGAPWDEPENWFGVIKQIQKDDAYGLCGTSWGSIHPSKTLHSRATTLSIGASLCWSLPLKSMKQLPIQPASKIYKQICYRNKMELPYAKNINHILIEENILSDEKLAKAIDFPLVYDFNSIISDTKNYRGVSFRSFNNKSKMSAMVLPPKTAPVRINIAKKAKYITFLHGTNRIKDERTHLINQKYQNSPAKYIIRYQNGKTEENQEPRRKHQEIEEASLLAIKPTCGIKLKLLQYITGWNSRMLASFVETGIFGSIGDKIHINIPSYTWINPFPDRLIKEIEIVPSNNKGITLVVYGLSIDN